MTHFLIVWYVGRSLNSSVGVDITVEDVGYLCVMNAVRKKQLLLS